MEHRFLLCVDARFPGGTSTAVISEIETLASRFDPDQIGILVVESAFFPRGTPTNQALASALEASPFPIYRFDDLRGAFIDWCLEAEGRRPRGEPPCRFLHAPYLVVHNPYVAPAIAKLAGRLSADLALVVCHQPYLDASGNAYYSAAEIVTAVGALAPEMRFVPIGQIVRQGFERHGWTEAHLAAFNWPNTFDFAEARSPEPLPGGLRSAEFRPARHRSTQPTGVDEMAGHEGRDQPHLSIRHPALCTLSRLGALLRSALRE